METIKKKLAVLKEEKETAVEKAEEAEQAKKKAEDDLSAVSLVITRRGDKQEWHGAKIVRSM